MAGAKKVVLKVDLDGERDKKKAIKAVSVLEGVDAISLDTKDNTMTVVGDVDPVYVLRKLRKCWYAVIVSVGPAKEPEKNKEEPKQDDDGKEKGKKSKEDVQVAELLKAYQAYNPPVTTYYVRGDEEKNTNRCSIL